MRRRTRLKSILTKSIRLFIYFIKIDSFFVPFCYKSIWSKGRWVCLWMKIFDKNSAQWANNRSWFVGSMPQWCSSSSVKLFSTIWSPRSNASNGGRISNHHRPWNILFWFVCPLQLLWISLIQQLWSLRLFGEDVKAGLK